MTDKEKLDLLESYVTTLLINQIDWRLESRFNKVDYAYIEGEIDALDKVRNFIKNGLRRSEIE